ncbi:SDR family oxidoreductase [Ligilactobacillus sp. WILCCON 0076]|uniref:SDR family oxidoreductase n=1 Tax=Ligilactobacillus ubinensis TaxID=2876789 RepID=A0A9X2JJU7_9LACO|nr:SDR family oxidoreductase [Ligilactobacillus ubinensis]MCP0885793.1 SDR family oxidoreductase [Ligilactobacillus ubinensis]
MKYGITASTGKFGQKAVTFLSDLVDKTDIVAFARNTKKATEILPTGIEIRQADYTDEASLEKAFNGIDRLLFISSLPGGDYPRDKQHLNVVQAAKAAGVGFIAYTSFPHANQAESPLAADHKITENALLDSGIAHSFLRNNWYLENQKDLIKGALSGQPFLYSAGEGRVGWALEREYAEGAVKVLIHDNPKEIYEFAGPALTFAELGETIKKISNNPFAIKSLSDDKYRQELEKNGLGEAADVILMIEKLIRDGELTEKTSDLTDILGRKLTPLTEAISEI